MDCAVVVGDGRVTATEARRVRKGDRIAVSRAEDMTNGVFVDYAAFCAPDAGGACQNFAFRTGKSRESSYSRDYDELYEILRHDRKHGSIVWVLGPAVAFDYDARRAMVGLVRNGYVGALFAGKRPRHARPGGGIVQHGLGQDIYTKELRRRPLQPPRSYQPRPARRFRRTLPGREPLA
jgi:hypothetical protein